MTIGLVRLVAERTRENPPPRSEPPKPDVRVMTCEPHYAEQLRNFYLHCGWTVTSEDI